MVFFLLVCQSLKHIMDGKLTEVARRSPQLGNEIVVGMVVNHIEIGGVKTSQA